MVKLHQPPASETEAVNALDDALVSRTDHRSVVDHIFFQASQQVSHEQSQAIARIAILGLVMLFLVTKTAINGLTPTAAENLVVGFSWLFYSLIHLWWTRRYRERFVGRRYLAIVGDLVCTSYVTYSFGLAGLGFYPLFLWIMIGNGLRFGPRYLFSATLIGISGFLIANVLDDVLFQHPGIVMGLLIGLIIMPKFFLVMIRRLAEANQALREQKDEAEYLARHDRLTDLPNRIMLEDRLGLALRKASRNGSRPAIVFIDLDGFKAINDNFGHEYGDMLLQEIAACLKARVRRGDTVARLGGDEFIILIEAANGPSEVAALVEQLFTCAGRYYQLGEYRAYVTWSCGVAIFPNDGRDSQTLIKNADTAMYRAKAAGANQFRLYDPAMSEEVATQLELRDQLRQALEARQFKLLYQPIGRYPEAAVDGIEAQIYWHRDQRDLVPLAEFSEILEQAGMQGTFGKLALEQALADAAIWHRAGSGNYTLEVEVTAQQLANADFLADLQRLLAKHELPPSALALQVNETILIKDSDAVAALLTSLHEQGARIVLNNFGTGYAALGFIKRYPIDRIIIAPSLITHLPEDPSSCTLVEALLAIAERTRIEVVADGVDTGAQLRWLISRGCNLMQGAHISKPLNAVDLEALLREGSLVQLAQVAGQ